MIKRPAIRTDGRQFKFKLWSQILIRMITVAMSVGLALTALVLSPASQALATTTQPPINYSFYVLSTSTSAMQTLGCNQAEYDNAVGHSSEVILDFGGMSSDGSEFLLVNDTPIPAYDAIDLVEWFDYGYAVCDPNYYVVIGIGTNNSLTLNSTNGAYFADDVYDIAEFGYVYVPGHVYGLGAVDIESFSDPSITPAQMYNWYDGYSPEGILYTDYGSVDGCPDGLSGTCSVALAGGGVDNNWGQGDYYNLSQGLLLTTANPEIYYTANAEEWAFVSEYGEHVNGPIAPWGPLDDYDLQPGTLTATGAWNAMVFFGFDNMIYSLEIHDDG